MAYLEFWDMHNMVPYLLKTEGSEDFHQIIDFLTTSHIKYALTENPTIYTSLIQQFWQTAAANTLSTEEVQITATINGKVKLVYEASIRRRIKLDDSDGISTLPNTEIFEQLALMGGNIDKSPFLPYDSLLPRVNILGSNEGSMTLNELTVLCTKLSQKVDSLEAYLKHTKEIYGAAYTKLIMKVKRLEKTVKSSQVRRGAKIVVSDDEELQDPSKQRRKVAKVHTYARRRRAISIASGGISTDEELVSTAGASMPISTAGMVDKGKAIMQEFEPEQTTTKLQQRQERAGYEAAKKKNLNMKVLKGKRLEKAQNQEKKEDDKLTQEDLQQMMMMIFADMLKKFDRDDLIKLWDLVKEMFSTTEPTNDKEKELWFELKSAQDIATSTAREVVSTARVKVSTAKYVDEQYSMNSNAMNGIFLGKINDVR
uniref:Xylulose kinase-1 n=1 Tax=Tanacetum cinerariifolium TaxID=118510 RepID=A0A6L2LKB7_TANCI|nr:xylulose kinase-1 [Tanacetum cinerariifolium]